MTAMAMHSSIQVAFSGKDIGNLSISYGSFDVGANAAVMGGEHQEAAVAWEICDYIGAIGIILAVLGFLSAFFEDTRSIGVLFPIGLALMAVAGYMTRDSDSGSV